MSRYAAVMFDLDGVLVDTREWVVSAFRYTAGMHGFAFEESALHPLFGQPLETCYSLLQPCEPPHAYVRTHCAYQREHGHLVRPFDDARVVLRALRDAGIRTGLVTGRARRGVVPILDEHRLADLLEVIVCVDDGFAHKPDPRPLLAALAQVGVEPARALMVGDAPADVACGRSAGCDTAGVTYGFLGAAIADSEPTYVLERLTEVLGLV